MKREREAALETTPVNLSQQLKGLRLSNVKVNEPRYTSGERLDKLR